MATNNDHPGSVTAWIEELKNRQPEAQRKIWERFINRVEAYANRVLRQKGVRTLEAEDIASIAFTQLFRSPADFQQLVDRTDLWRILVVLSERRVVDQLRRELALKHGAKKVFNETDHSSEENPIQFGLDGLPNLELTPEFEVLLAEELEMRLESLEDDILKQIAILKMHGFQNREIADKLSLSLRSVERKLAEIRKRLDESLC